MRFGFDFDNTFINYDKPALMWSKKNDLVGIDSVKSLKNFFRERGNYEEEWIEVQEWLYTRGLEHAEPGEGISDLIKVLNKREATIYIVSHKTPLSARRKFDLIGPAVTWLDDVLPRYFHNINITHFFEASRRSKIQRIRELKITHFVDDLLEVFVDESYPQNVKNFLLSTDTQREIPKNVVRVRNCKEIIRHV